MADLSSLTPEQWASLETSGAVPEVERVLKRDSLMFLRAEEIGCAFPELNVAFLARIDELEASNQSEQAVGPSASSTPESRDAAIAALG